MKRGTKGDVTTEERCCRQFRPWGCSGSWTPAAEPGNSLTLRPCSSGASQNKNHEICRPGLTAGNLPTNLRREEQSINLRSKPPLLLRPGRRASAPARPKSSGLRISGGIFSILLGRVLVIPALTGFDVGGSVSMSIMILIVALGSGISGVVLLALHRGKPVGAPVTVLSFAGLAVLIFLVGSIAGTISARPFRGSRPWPARLRSWSRRTT